MSWQQRYLDRFYARSRGWIDGTTEFHGLCASFIARSSRILEIGAGPSNATSRFLASIGLVTGVDPDPDVAQNDALARSVVTSDRSLPFADASFDACVSNYVIEHIDDPAAHLAEVARVLRPGGVYIFRTPNRFHYVALVSSLTPHWIHERIANRIRGLEGHHHPYPTRYRLNTTWAIRTHARNAGLDVVALRLIEKEPSYGMGSRALFLVFMVYERAVNATPLLKGLRANILGVLRRPL